MVVGLQRRDNATSLRMAQLGVEPVDEALDATQRPAAAVDGRRRRQRHDALELLTTRGRECVDARAHAA